MNEIDQNQVQTKAATIPQSASQVYASGELERLFRATFFDSHHTVLVGGASEPVYLPGHPHQICYSHDYFRSALHEIAHWCVAGAARRQQEDYGYWYAPDGRSADQQAEFAQAEVYPQALEALFCAACGHDFRVSLDNLNGDGGDEVAFALKVKAKAERLLAEGLAERPARWCEVLKAAYGREGVSLRQALQPLFA
ncbi:elongation factor P hydroxylase [Alcanivorax sp.]|uniref:elongation factor P hydroxylase n=1 Tax=Alcanivorax sp. TaxID=1872427 RepID=UPI0025B87619|nr:elongation factor P hydroxylase [Alcanivorax sp.]